MWNYDPHNVSRYAEGVISEYDWFEIIKKCDDKHYWSAAGDEFGWNNDCILLGSGTRVNMIAKKI